MKKFTLSVLTLGMAGFALPATASDLMIAATMQRCTTNEECQLVTNSCADNCGFVPVNKSNMPALQQMYQARCGKPMEANPACNMNPPIASACINSRCTIDYAYANNAGAKDYQSGAYGVPPAPVQNQVPGDYSYVNDRKGGFTAYDLPGTAVKQESVGQITTKVYVPPSAPVSGGNYVPVAPGAVVPVPAPAAATPSIPIPPPAPMAAPAYPVPAPAMAPAPASNIPPVAVPTSKTYATPPVMTPSKPNQLPPIPAPAPAATYVPSQTPSAIPAAGLPPAPRDPSAGAPVVPAVGATGVPQAPAGSVPIPPSDLKPAPTFVPPTGTAIPVSPEDPGALPPAGTTLSMPQDGKLTATTKAPAIPAPPADDALAAPAPPTGAAAPAVVGTTTVKKSFGGTEVKKSTYDINQ